VRKKEEGRRKKEEGRRKKEEGRRKKEEGRRKKRYSWSFGRALRGRPVVCHPYSHHFQSPPFAFGKKS